MSTRCRLSRNVNHKSVNHLPGQQNNNTCRRISAAAAAERKVLISIADVCPSLCGCVCSCTVRLVCDPVSWRQNADARRYRRGCAARVTSLYKARVRFASTLAVATSFRRRNQNNLSKPEPKQTTLLRRQLQLRFDFGSTAIRSHYDHSTTCVMTYLPTCCSCTAAWVNK